VQLGWEVVEGPPKSDAGWRTIALDAGTMAALRAHCCRRRLKTEQVATDEK
jgi:hypothetical protein